MNLPSRLSGFVYHLKVVAFRLRRRVTDRTGCQRYPRVLPIDPIGRRIECRSPLWTTDDPAEQSLEMGKVQNLRVAARALNGLAIPAGALFSFWRHVGPPTRRRGFVDGRALVQGCIVPSIGGGLCQLTNSLYELARESGFEIVERHAHTQQVPRSSAKPGRDATIAWNYIDLRFRPSAACRLAVEITRHELVVGFSWDEAAKVDRGAPLELRLVPSSAKSCETCGETDCFRHGTAASVRARTGLSRTAYLLDGVWPEFQRRLLDEAGKDDGCFVPTRMKRLGSNRYGWRLPLGAQVGAATSATIIRALHARQNLTPPQLRAKQLSDTARLAQRYAEQLRFDETKLVVDSSLLAAIAAEGALDGRSITVWLTQVPLKILHNHLDEAARLYPEFPRLADFRATDEEVKLQWQALEAAERIVTPHRYLADLLRELVPAEIELVAWETPDRPDAPIANEGYVYFAGPTAAREGAISMREAAKRLGLKVSAGGRNLESPDFWNGCNLLDSATDPMSRASVVVCGAVLKNRPYECLKALSMGKPLIATPGCGIGGEFSVPFGDVDALCEALGSLPLEK